MNPFKKLICLLPLLVLPACATLFSDSNDLITIRSNDPAAKLMVNGNQVGIGSATYSLPRGRNATVTAAKAGCSDMTVSTEKSIVNTTWLNLLFWPGFIIDAANGKMFEADPKNYTVNPVCIMN